MLRRLTLLSLAIFIFIEWGPLTWERAKYGIAAGDPFVREVALTFDDGPREHGMQELIAAMAPHNVKATFFLVGKFADRYGKITLMLKRAGHELANHTYTHPALYKLWVEKIIREAERCDEVMESLGIRKTMFLRPPGGGFNMNIFNAMRRMNKKLGLWSLNTADYTGRPDVILMHSGMPNTVEALPRIIERVKERGFTFVRLEELYSRGRI